MTIDDEFYVKIGRMTVAFGELDFMVAYLAANMAEQLGEGEPHHFTARKLENIKSWARKHEGRVGPELVDALVRVAGDIRALLVRRQDAVHGLWLQEGDASTAWTMKLPKVRPWECRRRRMRRRLMPWQKRLGVSRGGSARQPLGS